MFSSYNLYIPTALVSVLFCSSIPTSFLILLKLFFVLIYIFSSLDFQTTKLSDRSLYGFYKFISKLKQSSNAQNFKIKTTIATFRPRTVFFRQTHNYKTNRATKCAFCCSVCFVIVCFPEEDPSGSKRCNGCFDFKVLCIRSLF